MLLTNAIPLLESGDWEAAHVIAQEDPSELGSWAHAIVHLMEGDLRNAGYWYEKAGRDLPDPSAIATEIAALKAQLAASD